MTATVETLLERAGVTASPVEVQLPEFCIYRFPMYATCPAHLPGSMKQQIR
jgi:hypothetical protein